MTEMVAVDTQSRPKPRTTTTDVRASKRHGTKRTPKTRHHTLVLTGGSANDFLHSLELSASADDGSYHQTKQIHDGALVLEPLKTLPHVPVLLEVAGCKQSSSPAPPARAISSILASGLYYRIRVYSNRCAGCLYPYLELLGRASLFRAFMGCAVCSIHATA
jgi:hypothetical protein